MSIIFGFTAESFRIKCSKLKHTALRCFILTRSYEAAAVGLWRVLAHGVAAERGDDRHAD